MANIEIGFREKAGRNLLVLAGIPLVTLIWISVFIGIYEYATIIVKITGGRWEFWYLTTIIFAVITILELIVIIKIRVK